MCAGDLNAEDKATLATINERLSSLTSSLVKMLMTPGIYADLNADQLGGLPQSLIDAAEQAQARGLENQYVITQRSTQPS